MRMNLGELCALRALLSKGIKLNQNFLRSILNPMNSLTFEINLIRKRCCTVRSSSQVWHLDSTYKLSKNSLSKSCVTDGRRRMVTLLKYLINDHSIATCQHVLHANSEFLCPLQVCRNCSAENKLITKCKLILLNDQFKGMLRVHGYPVLVSRNSGDNTTIM